MRAVSVMTSTYGLRWLWLLLGWLVVMSAQAAPDQSVFGPKQYVRSAGGPDVYTESFTLPGQVVAPYLLHIDNGNPDGTNRVSAATVTLNGVQVAGPNDFGEKTAIIERTVSVVPSNTLEVRITGKPAGSFIKISVLGSEPLPTPVSVTPNPLGVYAGATGSANVALAPTPKVSGSLALSSNNPGIASVPGSVGFAANQSSITIPVTGVVPGNAAITASLNGGSATGTVQVTEAPPTISSLLPSALALTQGGNGNLTLTLSSAQNSDAQVALISSDPMVAGIPTNVTISAGQNSVVFQVAAISAGAATITATHNGSSASSRIDVTPAPPTVVSMLPAANTATLGANVTLNLTISSVQANATVVNLAVSPDGILGAPSSVTIPAGQVSVPVTISTLALGTAGITASLNGSSVAAAVHVTPPAPAVVSLAPSPLTLTQDATGTLTVTLNAAQLDNTDLVITVDNPDVLRLPATVTVPAGQTTASFTVTGLAVGDATVSVAVNGTTQSTMVHVAPYPPVPVSLLPESLGLQQGATGSLTLNINAAQLADVAIPLTNSAPGIVEAPAQVIVPMGKTVAVIPATALAPGVATLTATLNGATVSSAIEVTLPPPVVTELAPAQMSLPKGVPGTLRVTVSRAPTAPAVVQLVSSNPSVAEVPASTTIPAGALSAEFPVFTRGEGVSGISASLNGGSAATQVTVTAPELVALTLSPQTHTAYVGEVVSFTAQATYTDGSQQDLTSQVTWSSSDTTVATIASGAATALAIGSSTITVVSGSISTSTVLNVQEPPALTLSPASGSVKVGDTLTLSVTSAVPAGVNGVLVTLTVSGAGSANVPANVTIPAEQSAATFSLIGAAAGDITLTASAPQHITATAAYSVLPMIAISSLNPSSGEPGSFVEIIGNAFDADAAQNKVYFLDNVPADVVEASITRLKVKIPPTAQTGAITLVTPNGTAKSPAFTVIRQQDFTVSASPASQILLTNGQAVFGVRLASLGTQAFTGLAGLKVSNLPSGVTAKFSPQNLAFNQQGSLILTADTSASADQVTLTIEAEALVSGVMQKRFAQVDVNIQNGAGVTGVKGRFVTPEGQGIAGVRIGIDGVNDNLTISDAAGNFQLVGLPAGKTTLRMDSTPAHPLYPMWPAIIELEAGKLTVLPDWVINPPPADEKFTAINNATQDQIITDARYPGLEIKLPAGVTITGWDGVKKSRIAVERIEASKLPVPTPPVPTKEHYQLYFGTPMGGIPDQPIPVTVPNVALLEPGEKTEIWYFDGSPMGGVGEWKVAGSATVSNDGQTISTDPGAGIPRFCGVCGLYAAKCPPLPEGDPPPYCSTSGGNPVELYTGYEKPNFGGLTCSGLVPVEVGLAYTPVDSYQNRNGLEGSFGQGWFSDYEITLATSRQVPASKKLILPGGSRINFALQTDGNYIAPGDPRFEGAVLKKVGNVWELKYKDGNLWRFAVGDEVSITAFFLTEMIDPQGNAKQIVRRGDYKITAVGSSQRAHTYAYGANNLVSQITDPAGRNMKFTYNTQRRIETVTDADGGVTRYTYVDDNEYPTSSVCTQGTDGLRIKSIEYPGIAVKTENFHGTSRRVLRQTSRLGEHRFAYTVTGACVTHVSEPAKVCTANCPKEDSWDAFQAGWRFYGGQVVATRYTEPTGKETFHRFNSKGIVLEKTDPDGTQSKKTLNAQNRVTQSTDLLGRTTRYFYDAVGNLIAQQDSLGRTTETQYDPLLNLPTQVTRYLDDGSPVTTQTIYHATNRQPVKFIDAENRQTTLAYTTAGQLASMTDALGHTSSMEYNPAGDLVRSQDALGNITRLTADGAGRTTTTTTPKGYDWQQAYTGISQPKESTDPVGGKISYAYDTAHRLVSVTDQNGHPVQRYAYDERGNLASVTDAHDQSDIYQYDDANRLIQVTTRKGEAIQYQYDIQDRLTRVTRPDGATDYSYDAAGRLIQIAEGATRIQYAWDTADRLTREVTDTPTGHNSVEYKYDTLDRLTQRTVNDADPVGYRYDKSGRLTQLSYRGKTTSYTYDAGGRLIEKTLPNGIKQTIGYDAAGNVLQMQYLRPQ